MAFDKLIINSLTGVAKNGIKIDSAVDSLKEKIIDSISTQIENQLPIELPFSVRETLNGGNIPSNLLTPEYINEIKDELPESQKIKITETLDKLESNLNSIIQTKNTLSGNLNTITAPLNTIETLANTIGGIINGISTAIPIIKAIPIPLGAPLGVGVPTNVVIGFSDSLDNLKKLLDKFGGPLEIIPNVVNQINSILIPIVRNLNSLDPIFDKIIKIIAFIKLLLKSQPIVKEDIDLTLQNITNNIQESLTVTAGPLLSTSNIEKNKLLDKSLLSQLDINSNDPLFYKGFRLTIEYDPNNIFSFPARRIKAFSRLDKITLYSFPPDKGTGEVNTSSQYSFSTSTQVLIDEVKFNIDQYLNNRDISFTRANNQLGDVRSTLLSNNISRSR
jgi:hypothetical protein